MTASDGAFFIYGGLAVSPDAMVTAHSLVAEVRQKYGFAPTDSFKFHTRSRPKDMEIGTWTAAKTEVLQRAADIEDLDLITYVVLHDLARNTSVEDKMRFALNVTLSHFDMRYLPAKGDYGIVSVDRVDSLGYEYLEERFTQPIVLPSGREVPLTRTLHLSQTCDGASHMSSLVDIALGAFRYCVNTVTGQGRDEVARSMFPAVAKMMWAVPRVQAGKNIRLVGGFGFLKYPKVVRSARYSAQYEELADALTNLGVEPEPLPSQDDD